MPPLRPAARPLLSLPKLLQNRPVSTAPARRSLFLHVRPPPQSLEQRRSVLRAIERYGPTDFFRKTASHDSFLCIASTTNMADTLLKESPVEVAPLGKTTFAISIFPAPAYPHRATVRSGPLYGPWPADVEPALATSPSFKNTLVYNALRGVVPESASAEGMCDWRPRVSVTGEKEARIKDRRGRRSYVQRSVLGGLVGKSSESTSGAS